jgi:transposase
MTENRPKFYGGVDTHKDTHTAAVVDEVGRILATQTFAASPIGYRQLSRWLTGFGQVAAVGVEGTGSYGAGLTRHLVAQQLKVVEVNRPNRQLRRRRGKSDTVDAEAAARSVLNGEADAEPKSRTGIVESIRILRTVFTSTRNTRTRVMNQFHALLITAPDPIVASLAGKTSRQQIEAAAKWRPSTDLADPVQASKAALRQLAQQNQSLTTQTDQLTSQIDELTRQANPALRGTFGVGPDTAAALLVAAGDNPDRLESHAAFAALCGVSPVEASSGRLVNHRLNRGGDRQANSALWRIAVVRLSQDPATQNYAAKRTAEGKSTRHILRSLKRYIAREIYRLLVRPPSVKTHDDLRPMRESLGISMTAASKVTPFSLQQLSRIERGLTANHDMTQSYREWLTDQAIAA